MYGADVDSCCFWECGEMRGGVSVEESRPQAHYVCSYQVHSSEIFCLNSYYDSVVLSTASIRLDCHCPASIPVRSVNDLTT